MAALKNTRHEQFAQLVAAGKTPTESYRLAYPSSKGPAQSGSRLKEDARISARIAELCELAANIPVAANWLNRNFVLEGLRKVFSRAMEIDKLGDAVRALELMGKELGLFVERNEHRFVWDGDPSKLDEKQLASLIYSMERLAFGEDEAAARAERRRVLAEAGQVIEASAVSDTENLGPQA